MNYLARIFALISITLTVVFAFNISSLWLFPIFASAAVCLELTKYTLVQRISEFKADAKMAIAAVILILIGFSGYSSYHALDANISSGNRVVAQQQLQYEKDLKSYEIKMDQLKSDTLRRNEIITRISIEEQRADRNTITDRRIESLKSELSGIELTVPEQPVPPESKQTPMILSIIFSVLIEIGALVSNFFFGLFRKKSGETEKTDVEDKPESEIVQEKPIKAVVKTNKSVTKITKRKNVTPVTPEFTGKPTIKNVLGLTNSQRVQLANKTKALGYDWKSWNSDLNNIDEAKQLLKIK